MTELKDLQQISSSDTARMNQYDGHDFELPSIFKENVTEINNSKVIYNRYSAIIKTKGYQHGVLNIFMPNQWFYIASYFTDFYKELMLYKEYALKVTTKERLKEINKRNPLNKEEVNRIQQLELSEQSKKFLERFITDYDWWGGAKTIDRGDFYVSPILSCARLVNASQSYVADLCAFLADKQELVKLIIKEGDRIENNSKHSIIVSSSIALPRQVIYYGAPGTGKSYTIKEKIKGKHAIRTTFHPDSDYSTFVGAYKPTTMQVPRYISLGDKAIKLKDGMGKPIMESRIEYEFVEQAFLQAYINAWKLYAKSENEEKSEEQYLVIEEINRGNCAQIFGDLFQLLDRQDNGFSEYPITADTDMQKHLARAFSGMEIANAFMIDEMYDEPEITKKIIKGEVLLLPSNLYIWATMNTSDQSLFPIDSAFKRRWEWKYVPISKGVDKETNMELNWRIQVNGSCYDWWSFLEKINERIGSLTSSQDKKLGFFFCKARNGIITAEQFVDKVLFFIWNEVLKDYEKEQDFLKDGDSGNYLTFDQFYRVDANGKTVINEEKAEVLLNNLGLERIQVGEDAPADTDEQNGSSAALDLYESFWKGFNDSYEGSGKYKEIFTNPSGFKRQSWFNLGGLNRKYYLALLVLVQKKVARIQLYFPNGEPEYEKYVDQKAMMEEKLGEPMVTHEANKCSFLQIEKPFELGKDDPNTVYRWFHEKSVIFKELCDEIDPK